MVFLPQLYQFIQIYFVVFSCGYVVLKNCITSISFFKFFSHGRYIIAQMLDFCINLSPNILQPRSSLQVWSEH